MTAPLNLAQMAPYLAMYWATAPVCGALLAFSQLSQRPLTGWQFVQTWAAWSAVFGANYTIWGVVARAAKCGLVSDAVQLMVMLMTLVALAGARGLLRPPSAAATV